MIFSNPWVIVIICIAFGAPLLGALIRFILKKCGKDPDSWRKRRDGNRDAQHVRDAVRKYDKKNQK